MNDMREADLHVANVFVWGFIWGGKAWLEEPKDVFNEYKNMARNLMNAFL